VAPDPAEGKTGAIVFVITSAVLVVGGVVLALLFSRSQQSDTSSQPGVGVLPTAPATVPQTRSVASSAATATGGGTWPAGATGWTVVIATLAKHGHPRAAAERIAASVEAPGLAAHVLDSSLHPRLRPGLWIVFAGRFSSRALALRAARQLHASGTPRAVVERLTG
jgi:septal ring-binding cell division protein DamX